MQPDRVVLQEAPATLVTTRDFTSCDAYLGSTEIHFWNGEGAQRRTDTIELQPPQQDTRVSRHEIPSALGRYFAMGDFSHGQGQPYFDYESSDDAKVLHLEGFDTSEPGILRHLNAVLAANGGALTAGSSGRSAICQGKLFVCDGTNLRVYDPITGIATTENPHAGEGAVTVQDVTAEGDRLFVALGANGIHLRDAAGTYTHYNAAAAIRVAWVKDRLCAASARSFYEVTASGAAPPDKQPLKEGWTYTDIGENGPYIYAPAIHETSGLSKVFHFGLDNSLAVAVQGSTWMPNDELVYAFKGYLGVVLLSCGRINKDGGKDQVYYKAVPTEDGFLPIQLVTESKGAGSRDLASRGIATDGRRFLAGMTLGSTSPFGVREGLMRYDPALDSFAHHLASSTSTATPDPVLSVIKFEGRICFVTIDGVYYEDTSKKVSQAYFISSTSTFRDSGLKKWDESKITTKKLPATSSVDFQYALTAPEDNIWSLAGTHSTTDETEATFRHQNVESPRLTVKVISNATSSQASAPEIEGFSVRVNPTVENVEYRLIRTIHLIGTIAKGQRGAVKNYNPLTERNRLRTQMFDFFDWHEVDASYNLRLVQMSELMSMTNFAQTGGDPRKMEWAVVVVMDGRVT